MKKQNLQQRPPYPIESVDNALRLLQLLRDGGGLRLTDAAEELGVASSTAHRLMAMLVYRGFAVQDDRRRYVAGPALGSRAIGAPWIRKLRALAAEPMEILSVHLNETVNLVVRVGVNIRFLWTVEARAVLRIGDRAGTVIPAIGASGGKALLALEPEDRLRNLYQGKAAQLSATAIDDNTFAWLLRELATVRNRGYALSREETEAGVGAVGVVITGPSGIALGALTVATPIARLDPMLTADKLAQIFHCRDEISAAASDLTLDGD